MVKVVRDWFKRNLTVDMPWHKEIWLAYNEFEYDYENILTSDGYNPKDIEAMTFSDIIDIMNKWIERYKAGKIIA